MKLNLDLSRFKPQLKMVQQVDQQKIFDPIRKKYLVFTPEELVRQLFILYLIEAKKYPKNRIAVEKAIQVNELSKRCDLIIYDPALKPLIIVECKSPKVKLNDSTFRQAAIYNLSLQVPYLIITNGLETYVAKIDFKQNDFCLIDEIPEFIL